MHFQITQLIQISDVIYPRLHTPGFYYFYTIQARRYKPVNHPCVLRTLHLGLPGNHNLIIARNTRPQSSQLTSGKHTFAYHCCQIQAESSRQISWLIKLTNMMLCIYNHNPDIIIHSPLAYT